MSTDDDAALRRRRLGIPEAAWRHPMGAPAEAVGHSRVTVPMIDDGEWAGVPLGGLGAGSIGLTQRGDFARWHLRVGEHHFLPVAADGFAIQVRTASGTWGGPLAAGTAPTLDAFGPARPVGAGTYHALFPRAWITYDHLPGGIQVSCEQLAPFLPGDEASTSLPVGVFSWTLENPLAEAATVGIMFTLRDPRGEELGVEPAAGAWHEIVRNAGSAGILLHSGPDAPADLDGTVSIAALDGPGVRIGLRSRFDPADPVETAGLWADFSADAALDDLDDRRPAAPAQALGAAISATVDLAPGESRVVAFALAWDLPVVQFGAGRSWHKHYTRDWGTTGQHAFELAGHGLSQLGTWRSGIEAWQAPVLTDQERPDWYKAALFNELYFLLDGGTFWGREADPAGTGLDQADEFGMIECFDYPFYTSADVNFYASFAILALWPELELASIRNLARGVLVDDPSLVTIDASRKVAVRKVAFAVPHDVGGPDEDPFRRPNRYKFQDANLWKDLGPKFVLQVWRDHRATGDLELLRSTWPSVIRNLEALTEHDRDDDGLPEHDGSPDQTYDTWPIHGPSAYGGSLWLGALRAAEEIALTLGDDAAAAGWRVRYERARGTFEARLWRGDHYAFDDGGGPSSDSVMADQLVGQWYADACGLGDLIDPARIDTTLRTIYARNVLGFAGGLMGAVNGTRPDGTVDRSSEQSQEVWTGTVYGLAAFMLGRGLTEEAWATAQGVARVTYERGLWFRTPEAYDEYGDFRASIYLRPLAIWAIEEALTRSRADAKTAG